MVNERERLILVLTRTKMHLGTSLCILTGKRLDGKKLINLGEVLKGHFFYVQHSFHSLLGPSSIVQGPGENVNNVLGTSKKC